MPTRTERGRARVVYVQYANPAAYPPVEHSAWILAAAGADVLVLGTITAGDRRAFRRHERIRTKLLRFQSPGWRQKLHYLRFSLWVATWVVRWRPQWVYASDPLSSPVAVLLSWLPGVRLVYHEHDSPAVEEATGRAGSTWLRLVMTARRSAIRRSAVSVVPNAHRGEVLRAAIQSANVLTVWNCPLRDEVRPARPQAGTPGLRVFFHGSIVPARLPASIIQAIAQLPSRVSLVVAGYETTGHAGYSEQLLRFAEQLGVADRIQFVGQVPTRDELLTLCATCDVGLAFMPTNTTDLNEQAMVGASNKPFDYLACGLALLVSDRPDWRAMYVDQDVARYCDPLSASSLAGQLQWFLDHPVQRVAMGERGREKILSDWNYESQFLPVMKWMTVALPMGGLAMGTADKAEPSAPCSR